MEQEQWKPIQEFNGEYEVSNLGRVRSMKRYYGVVGRIMPQTIQRKGYYAVTFWMNNKAYCRKVHRLVIEAFTPNPDNLPCINHIDGDKLNNHVSNLEWCTYQANMQHAVRTGLTHPHGMLHVRLVGAPFEVAHMIVELVAVDMVDARQVVGVWCECLDDQPMHLAAICFVVHPEGHGIVAFALNGLWHDAPNHSVVPLH